MKPIARIRRAIDREWIRVGWVGTQTLKHRLMSLGPLLVLTVPALIIEPFSYGAAGAFLLSGVLLTIVASLWIERRRLAGTGHSRRDAQSASSGARVAPKKMPRRTGPLTADPNDSAMSAFDPLRTLGASGTVLVRRHDV